MSIQKIDLNLFRVFAAIMSHRTVAAASRELGVTASAVSHALARLRLVLDDELFISGEGGMEPTPRALELAPGIGDGLERISVAIEKKIFVPSQALRTFRIAATDYSSTIILPHLIERLTKSAPQINIRMFPFNRMDVIRQLDDGRVDFVLGWFGDVPDRMQRRSLLIEQETILVREQHPLAQETLTKEKLLAFPHIVVELSGSEEDSVDGYIDERGVLRRVWIERLLIEENGLDGASVGRVALSVPHYAAVAPILSVTDMVATLPRRLALGLAHQYGLRILDLPYDPLKVAVEAIWHHRANRDRGVQWLIDELFDAVKSLDAC